MFRVFQLTKNYNYLYENLFNSLFESCPDFLTELVSPDNSYYLPYNISDDLCPENSYGWQSCLPSNYTVSQFCGKCISLCNELNYFDNKSGNSLLQAAYSTVGSIAIIAIGACITVCSYRKLKKEFGPESRLVSTLTADTQSILTQLNWKIQPTSTCRQLLKNLRIDNRKLQSLYQHHDSIAQPLFTLFNSSVSKQNKPNIKESVTEAPSQQSTDADAGGSIWSRS